MFRMLMSVIASDYNRVLCIRRTRNNDGSDEQSEFNKKQEKETTEYIFKETKNRGEKAAPAWRDRALPRTSGPLCGGGRAGRG